MQKGGLMKTSDNATAPMIPNPLLKPVIPIEHPSPPHSVPASTSATTHWQSDMDPMLRRVAASDLPVLVVGETGSGKEFVARQIHSLSARSRKAFIKLNCAALPPELFERQLFGSDAGPLDGAAKSSPGHLELADEGTILLDEIGDMDPRLQAKLLQVLEDQQFFRLGATEATKVDVRVIATTHLNLETHVEIGEFRRDLYYRLNVMNVAVPPLRERRGDIIPLALLFLKKYSRPKSPPTSISSDLSTALIEYSWPGNVRELENAMRSYVILKDPACLIHQLRGVADWRSRDDSYTIGATAGRGVPGASIAEAAETPLARVNQAKINAETELIVRALISTFWNRKRAALALGMDYRAFLYKMKKLGIMENAMSIAKSTLE